MPERTVLTRAQVEAAERREGITHPVITILERKDGRLRELSSNFPSDREAQQRYIKDNYGFLADSLEELGDFSVMSLDLVAIWSKVGEFEYFPRYEFSAMFSTAFALAGVNRPEYRGFTRAIFKSEGHDIPELLLRDKESLEVMSRRLDEISASLKELDYYVFGTYESPMSLAFDLAGRKEKGDKDAAARLGELIKRDEEFSTPILHELHENFGNGLVPIRLDISEALGDK